MTSQHSGEDSAAPRLETGTETASEQRTAARVVPLPAAPAGRAPASPPGSGAAGPVAADPARTGDDAGAAPRALLPSPTATSTRADAGSPDTAVSRPRADPTPAVDVPAVDPEELDDDDHHVEPRAIHMPSLLQDKQAYKAKKKKGKPLRWRRPPRLRPPLRQPPVGSYKGSRFLWLRHGNGKAVHSEGMTYEGSWFLGYWSGQGMLTHKKGWTYRGRFARGMFNGQGTLKLSNGVVMRSFFRNSVPRGKVEIEFKDGAVFMGRWLRRRLRGSWEDALVAKGNYVKPGEKQRFARLQNRVQCIGRDGKEKLRNGVISVRNGLLYGKWQWVKVFYYPDILQGHIKMGCGED